MGKQSRQEMQRKYKKERIEKLKKQQKRRQRLLKEKKSALDHSLLADDVLLNDNHNGHKHNNVSEIDLSDSEQPIKKKIKKDAVDSDTDDSGKGVALDLDSFIEGVLDGIGGSGDVDSSDT